MNRFCALAVFSVALLLGACGDKGAESSAPVKTAPAAARLFKENPVMAKKKKTLPKNFKELIEAGDLAALQAVFETCEVEARGGYGKATALSFYQAPDDLVRWLVEQGADIDAQDKYQRTALHHQASSWRGNVELFLSLGANIEALDYQDETPLHHAAGSFKPKAVRILVAHGANIHAQNKSGKTPLAKALAVCRNSDLAEMAEVAEILLAAGDPVTPEIREAVERIGKTFEFHRAGFNKDFLAEADAGLRRLYQLFGVTPAQVRRVHDGVEKITVTATDWHDQHTELWDWLVPAQGHAKTTQGEVIRITGRVADEILGNGGGNWDADYRKMLDALLLHLNSGAALTPEQIQEATALAKRLRGGDGDQEELARLTELAVRWVLANPDPVQLKKPDYQR